MLYITKGFNIIIHAHQFALGPIVYFYLQSTAFPLSCCVRVVVLSPENMIYKGLNDEEAVFLQQLADKRAQVEVEARNEEREELQAYRVCEDQYTILQYIYWSLVIQSRWVLLL